MKSHFPEEKWTMSAGKGKRENEGKIKYRGVMEKKEESMRWDEEKN